MSSAAQDKAQANQIAPELSNDKLIDMLKSMMQIRRFEERTMQSYMQQKIGGFCHIYIGQEAVAVGSISALKSDDPIVGAYRDHGFALARGMDPKYAMAEMFGKVTGCSKGKGGSMHFFDKEHHMYGGHAIVGGQCPLGTGLAFASQYEKKDNVTLCYLGDGAVNQGAFHEAMNLAAIWNLPIIFVLENNSYSMGTHINRGTAMANDLRAKAEAYGMRYAECDGLDVLDVYTTFKREVDKTRNAKNPQWERGMIPSYKREGEANGPCFMNVKTYRYKGHSMSDPQKYRAKEEVEAKQELDPINRLVNLLIEKNISTQDQIDEFDKAAKAEAQAAVKYANESPDMPQEELFTDIYVNPYGPYKKGELPEMLKGKDLGE
ncbi:pyruvate dehydrogenase (acetyl-transferring) E1 component subunit alpha [Planctomycetota bacterium]|nr:pyruvate dehydrogenase (acetyl-transferring) E1 component subunit alpha [Planctomycetota bacterium]